jgi:hypothetical protein
MEGFQLLSFLGDIQAVLRDQQDTKDPEKVSLPVVHILPKDRF